MSIKEFFKNTKFFIISLINKMMNFIKENKSKFDNLYETNFNTGMYHLKNGHLWDASLRFKIIKKFWPEKLEAQYQYAYCLVLQELNQSAINLLTEILEKKPDYDEARVLLDKINNQKTEAIIKDYQDELANNQNQPKSDEKDN